MSQSTAVSEAELLRREYIDADTRAGRERDAPGAYAFMAVRARMLARQSELECGFERQPSSSVVGSSAGSSDTVDDGGVAASGSLSSMSLDSISSDHGALLREFALLKVVKTALRQKFTDLAAQSAAFEFLRAFLESYAARLRLYDAHLQRLVAFITSDDDSNSISRSAADDSASLLRSIGSDEGFHTAAVLLVDNDAACFLAPGTVDDVVSYNVIPETERLAVMRSLTPTHDGVRAAADVNASGSVSLSEAHSPDTLEAIIDGTSLVDSGVADASGASVPPESHSHSGMLHVWSVLPDKSRHKWSSFFLVDMVQHFGSIGGFDAIMAVLQNAGRLQRLAADSDFRQHRPLLDGTQLPMQTVAFWLELIHNIDSKGYFVALRQMELARRIEELMPPLMLTRDTTALRKMNKAHFELATRLLSSMCDRYLLLDVLAQSAESQIQRGEVLDDATIAALELPDTNANPPIVKKFSDAHGAEWVERLQLLCAVHFFSCEIFEKRIYGITCLNDIVALVSAAERSSQANSSLASTGSRYGHNRGTNAAEAIKNATRNNGTSASVNNSSNNNNNSSSSSSNSSPVQGPSLPPNQPKWLRGDYVCQFLTGTAAETSRFEPASLPFLAVLFGPSAHVQLIQRSAEIVAFLCVRNSVGPEHIDLMWTSASAAGVHEAVSVAILSIIGKCGKAFREPALAHLAGKFESWQKEYRVRLTNPLGDQDRARSSHDFLLCVRELARDVPSNRGISDPRLFRHRFVSILWNIFTSVADLPVEQRAEHVVTSAFALTHLRELVRLGCFINDEEYWLRSAIEAILSRSAVAGFCYEFLGSLLASFPAYPIAVSASVDFQSVKPRETLNAAVTRLQADWGLLEPVFFDELADFKFRARARAREVLDLMGLEAPELGGMVLAGCTSYVEEIRLRLNFFAFAMSHYGFLLPTQRFQDLFDWCAGPALSATAAADDKIGALVEDERSCFFEFCVAARSSVADGYVALDDDSASRLFATRFARADASVASADGIALDKFLDLRFVTPACWSSLRRLLSDTNVIHQKCTFMPDASAEILCDSAVCLPDRIYGYATVWSIILETMRTDVAAAAIEFLLQLHVYARPSREYGQRALRSAFLQRLFDCLAHSRSSNNLIAVGRLLDLLVRYTSMVETNDGVGVPSHASANIAAEVSDSRSNVMLPVVDRPVSLSIRLSTELRAILRLDRSAEARDANEDDSTALEFPAEVHIATNAGATPQDLQHSLRELFLADGFGVNGTSSDIMLFDERGLLITASDSVTASDSPAEPADKQGEGDGPIAESPGSNAASEGTNLAVSVRLATLSSLGLGFNGAVVFARASLEAINARRALQTSPRTLTNTSTALVQFEHALDIGLTPTMNRARDQVSGTELPANRRFDQLIASASSRSHSLGEDQELEMKRRLSEMCDISDTAAGLALERADWDLNNAVILMTEDDAKREIVRSAVLRDEETRSDMIVRGAAASSSSVTELSMAQLNAPSTMISDTPRYFDALFALLSFPSGDSQSFGEIRAKAWSFLMQIPTHALGHSTTSLLSHAIADPSCTAFTLLYALQVVDKHTRSSLSGSWIISFVADGGLNELLSVVARSSAAVSASFVSHDVDRDNDEWLQCLALSLKTILRIHAGECRLSDASDGILDRLASVSINLACLPNLTTVGCDVCVYIFRFLSTVNNRTPSLFASASTLRDILLRCCYSDVRAEYASALIDTSRHDLELAQSMLNMLLALCPTFGTDSSDEYSVLREYFSAVLSIASLPYFKNSVKVVDGTDTTDLRACFTANGCDWLGVWRICFGGVEERPVLERRRGGRTDELLCGLLSLCRLALRRGAAVCDARVAADRLFHYYLFDVVPGLAQPPKCKSRGSRQCALRLLVEITRASASNDDVLPSVLSMLQNDHYSASSQKLDLSSPVSGRVVMPPKQRITQWDYHPSSEDKSDCGFVGLKNLGNTCYMNSLVQQLFMAPGLRESVFAIEVDIASSDSRGHESSLLYQLQRIFAYLQESETAAYAPEGFCKAFKDWEGNSINVHQQQDVDEFLGLLFDRIESALPPSHKRLFQDLFGGTIANEIRSIEPEFPYVSERTEDFLAFSIGIKNKRSVVEALDAHIAPERLEGDNAYNCDLHGRKIAAAKRVYISKLPDNLMLHLRRFEFDYTTYRKQKINDFCSFPRHLDMRPWSKQGLFEAEGRSSELSQEDCHPPEYYQYALRGVLVHSGGADAGHYYSYVMLPDQSGWVELNDKATSFFNGNDDASLASECFGGTQEVTSWDSYAKHYVTNTYDRVRSAYMLLYARVNPETPQLYIESPSTHHARGIPVALYNDVWLHNTAFLRDRQLFDSSYFGFVLDLFESVCARFESNAANASGTGDAASPILACSLEMDAVFFPFTCEGDGLLFSDEELIKLDRGGSEALEEISSLPFDGHELADAGIGRSANWYVRRRSAAAKHLQAAQTLTRFVLEILFHAKDGIPFIERATSLLRRLLQANIASSRWFLLHQLGRRSRNLARAHTVRELLLECTNEPVRMGYLQLCAVASQIVFLHEREILSEEEVIAAPGVDVSVAAESSAGRLVSQSIGARSRPRSVFIRWFEGVFSFFEDSRLYWRRFKQYFSMLNCIAAQGPEIRLLLLERYRIVTVFADYYMGRATTAYPRRVPVMDRFNLPDLTPFVATLEQILRGCNLQPDNSPTQPLTALTPLVPIPPTELKEFLDKTFLTAMLEMDYARENVSRILVHISWENYRRSRWLLELIMNEVSKGWLTDKLPIFVGLLLPLLTDCDDSLANVRTVISLSPFATTKSQYSGYGNTGYTSSTPKGGLLAMAQEVATQNGPFALHLVRVAVKIAFRSDFARRFLLRQPRELGWCMQLLEAKLGLGDYAAVVEAERSAAKLESGDSAPTPSSSIEENDKKPGGKRTYAEAARQHAKQSGIHRATQSDDDDGPVDDLLGGHDATFDDTELLVHTFGDDVEDSAIVDEVWHLPTSSRRRSAAELRRRLFTRTLEQIRSLIAEAGDPTMAALAVAPAERQAELERERVLRENMAKLEDENTKLKRWVEAFRIFNAAQVAPAPFMLAPEWHREVEQAGGPEILKFLQTGLLPRNGGIPVTSTVHLSSPESSSPPPLVDFNGDVENSRPTRSEAAIRNLGRDHDDIGSQSDPDSGIQMREFGPPTAPQQPTSHIDEVATNAADVAKARPLLDIVPTLSITAAVLALRRAEGDLDMAAVMCFDEAVLSSIQADAAAREAEGRGFDPSASSLLPEDDGGEDNQSDGDLDEF